MTAATVRQPPKLWAYLLGATVVLAVLIPLWAIFVMTVIQPDSLTVQEQTMGNRLLWWVAGPVALVTLLLGGRFLSASQQANAQEPRQQAQVQQAAAVNQHEKREYVLEVIGLGVTLDKYRQGALWDALQKGSPYVTIREQDPKKYDWSAFDKDGTGGGRANDALENGAQDMPMYWGTPSFYAGPPIANPARQPGPDRPISGLAAGAETTGMAWHLFVTGSGLRQERPDRLLEEVFAFFDAHPDVPYVMIASDDGMGRRDMDRAPGTAALLRDGYYIPEMPDAVAVFVLARRERVDALRPFVWTDPDNDFVQERLRSMYYQLQYSVPHPRQKKTRRTPAQVGADPDHKDPDPDDLARRLPTVNEWLQAAAGFAQRSEVRGTGVISTLGDFNPWAHHPPRDWKPTPWFPIPWNRAQLATFDRLPTLGYLHRPTFVKLTDDEGKPLSRRADREKALQEGWQQALQTLPEAERAKAPARVIAATGGNTEQLIALHGMLNHHAQQGGPEIDSGKSSQFIDTDRRLGNTGAATWFVQTAIGVIGSYRDGGVSAAINLRDPNEASIIMISPPPEDKRKSQKRSNGGDIWKHAVTPAIDPANYPPR